MRFKFALATLAVVMLAMHCADTARVRISAGRSIRIRSSYRSYRYTYYSGPLYTRRLSPSVMGAVYYGYSSRYPLFFSYRRTPIGSDDTCKNYLATSNGSYVGAFSCPFLPDEPDGWTRCCGYENEEFCCDPSYDDSWKNTRLSTLAIALIVVFSLIGAAGLIVLIVCCCCCCKSKHQQSSSGSATAQQSTPFVDGKQAEGSYPVAPPYPTMEYGTIPVQPHAGAGQAPYPPPPPPYPPPYSSSQN